MHRRQAHPRAQGTAGRTRALTKGTLTCGEAVPLHVGLAWDFEKPRNRRQAVGSVCRFSGSPRARPEHVSAARSMQSQAGEMWHHMALSTSWLPHMMKTWIGPWSTGPGSGFIDGVASSKKQVSISSAMVRLCGRNGGDPSRCSALAVGGSTWLGLVT